jgi:O-antigen ligase
VGSWRRLKQFDVASIFPLTGSFLVFVILVSGQVMTRSRAGLALTIIALCGVFCLSFADRRSVSGITPAKLALGATALAVVVSIQFALYRVLDRFATDPLADDRVAFAHTTIAAANAYMPLGSGIGTFVPIYAMFERPKDAMIDAFVNHAHDDFLEVWLEAGVAGIGLMGAFGVWFISMIIKVWRRPPTGAREIDHSLARSATMIIALLVVHSFVDYPLRTSAMAAVFAFCCALLIEPVSGAARESIMEDENMTDNMMREGMKAGIAVTAIHQRDAIKPISLEPGAGRWGEDIDWPSEWRNRPQT